MGGNNRNTRSALAALWVAAALSATAHAQPQSQPQPQPPGINFTAVDVADLARAERFYVTGLGMKPALRLTPPEATLVKVGYNFTGDPRSPEPLLILIDDRTQDSAPTKGVKLGVRVDDAAAVMQRLKAAGYTILSDARPRPDIPIIQGVARDPDGVVVEVTQMK
jgi:catechol 2,3-dioxygenase-like lactoylglutathione lyase family enzyme